MAWVRFVMSRAELLDGTAFVVSCEIDDAEMVAEVPGEPPTTPIPGAYMNEAYGIVAEVTGPGRGRVDIWRGTTHTPGQPPWRTSDALFPNGISAADSPVLIEIGGPVKRWDDVHWRISAAKG